MVVPPEVRTHDARTVPARARRRRGRSRTALLAGALVVFAGAGALPVLAGQPEVVLEADFEGADGTFASAERFWGSEDQGLAQNREWFSEDGSLGRRGGTGQTEEDRLRLWSRSTALSDPIVRFRLTFDGWSGGDEDWRGVNLWLNRTLCTPVPDCSAVSDPGGNSGYMLRFVAADGKMVINKKVPGDTRGEHPEGAVSVVQGGTYYSLASTPWEPQEGRTYELEGRVEEDRDGSREIRMTVDGETLLEVVDDGSVGGDPLSGGRVGLRSDWVDMTVDDLQVLQ